MIIFMLLCMAVPFGPRVQVFKTYETLEQLPWIPAPRVYFFSISPQMAAHSARDYFMATVYFKNG